MKTHIKTTRDGRRVEVIGMSICLDGELESDKLVAVIDHPHWRAILQTAPEATHMAGRVALSVDEAEKAQLALDAARAASTAVRTPPRSAPAARSTGCC